MTSTTGKTDDGQREATQAGRNGAHAGGAETRLAKTVDTLLPERTYRSEQKGLTKFFTDLYSRRADKRIREAVERSEIDPKDVSYIELKAKEQAATMSAQRDGKEPLVWELFIKPVGVALAFIAERIISSDKTGKDRMPSLKNWMGASAAAGIMAAFEVFRLGRRFNARLDGAIAGAIASLENESRNQRLGETQGGAEINASRSTDGVDQMPAQAQAKISSGQEGDAQPDSSPHEVSNWSDREKGARRQEKGHAQATLDESRQSAMTR